MMGRARVAIVVKESKKSIRTEDHGLEPDRVPGLVNANPAGWSLIKMAFDSLIRMSRRILSLGEPITAFIVETDEAVRWEEEDRFSHGRVIVMEIAIVKP